MERNHSIEPEVLPKDKESMAISGIKYALVAATGVSLAIAAEIALKQYKKAKKEAIRNQVKE
jgi:hypothetical protein